MKTINQVENNRNLIKVNRNVKFVLQSLKLNDVLEQIQDKVKCMYDVDICNATINFNRIWDNDRRCDNTVVSISYENYETSTEYAARVSKENEEKAKRKVMFETLKAEFDPA
jgi:hypothetical protein